MVNSTQRPLDRPAAHALRNASLLVRAYLILTAATIAALVVLAFTVPSLATSDAWGHAIVVGVFAVVLPLASDARRAEIVARSERWGSSRPSSSW